MPSPFASCEVLAVTERGVVQAAAYGERRARRVKRTGRRYRPRNTDQCIAHDLLLPPGSAREYQDPDVLWNAIELRLRPGTELVGLAFVLALPRENELELPECLDLARAFAAPFVADGLPVQIDIHRVEGSEDGLPHRHAHLVVGLARIRGERIIPGELRHWCPRVRGQDRPMVEALDWCRIWSAVQQRFFAERGIALGVPPPSGMPEPKLTRLGRLISAERKEQVAQIRAERGELISNPADVLRVMTRDWLVFGRTDLEALLRSAIPDEGRFRTVRQQVLDHPDLVRLGDDPRQPNADWLTTAPALNRLAGIMAALERVPTSSVVVAPDHEAMLHALADVDKGSAFVWADPWVRNMAGEAPDFRHWFARRLPDLAAGNQTLGWSEEQTVTVVGVERLSDHELEAVVHAAAGAGAELRLIVGLQVPFALRRHGIWQPIVETVLGHSLPPSKAQISRLAVLRTRLAGLEPSLLRRAEAMPGIEPAGVLDLDDPESAPLLVVPDGRLARREGTRGLRERRIGHDDLAAVITPRQAWFLFRRRVEILIREVEDCEWALPLFLAGRGPVTVTCEGRAATDPEQFIRDVAESERAIANRMFAMMGLRLALSHGSRDDGPPGLKL